jgi:hypothetical protein
MSIRYVSAYSLKCILQDRKKGIKTVGITVYPYSNGLHLTGLYCI